jgi:hypothetical protein
MTPEQVRAIVEEVVSKHAVSPLYLTLVPLLVVGLIALLAVFLGAYLKAKAEIVAKTEDLKAVTLQLRETTRAAKEVEASISGKSWLDQRRWDLRRDVYSQLLEALQEQGVKLRASIKVVDHNFESFKEYWNRAIELQTSVVRAAAIGGIFLPPDARAVIGELAHRWNEAMAHLKDPRTLKDDLQRLADACDDAAGAMTLAARVDLDEGLR